MEKCENHLKNQSSNLLSKSFLFSVKAVLGNRISRGDNTTSTISQKNFRKGKYKYGHYLINSNQIIYLSKRQTECLQLLKENTMKEMAYQLGLSCRTIEYYITNLKVKLKCHTKRELLNFASKIQNI